MSQVFFIAMTMKSDLLMSMASHPQTEYLYNKLFLLHYPIKLIVKLLALVPLYPISSSFPYIIKLTSEIPTHRIFHLI